jgi:hypothetical protein
LRSKKGLLDSFGCDEDYHITVLDDRAWSVSHEEGVSFLTYLREDGEWARAVIVNRDKAPLICRSEELTMIVAIDCIKIAFIMKNNNEL